MGEAAGPHVNNADRSSRRRRDSLVMVIAPGVKFEGKACAQRRDVLARAIRCGGFFTANRSRLTTRVRICKLLQIKNLRALLRVLALRACSLRGRPR